MSFSEILLTLLFIFWFIASIIIFVIKKEIDDFICEFETDLVFKQNNSFYILDIILFSVPSKKKCPALYELKEFKNLVAKYRKIFRLSIFIILVLITTIFLINIPLSNL